MAFSAPFAAQEGLKLWWDMVLGESWTYHRRKLNQTNNRNSLIKVEILCQYCGGPPQNILRKFYPQKKNMCILDGMDLWRIGSWSSFLDPAALDKATFGAKFDAVILDRKRNLMTVSSLRQESLHSGHDGSVEDRFLIILVGVRYLSLPSCVRQNNIRRKVWCFHPWP